MFNNKKLMFLSLLFVFVLSVGMVSAGDNATFEGDILQDGGADEVLQDKASATPVVTSFEDVVVGENYTVSAYLKTIESDPVANKSIDYSYDDVNGTVSTDGEGHFNVQGARGSVLVLNFAGDDSYQASTFSISFKSAKLATQIVGKDYTQYAIDYYAGERGKEFTVSLVDENGNPVANKTINIGYNGITLNRTTDANGKASVQINLANAGSYTFAVVFLGDKDYNASMAVYTLKVNKKSLSFSASAKSFKSTVKTKKYTVTLKSIKGSSSNGKAYLKAGKKVTLKVNGKTYTAKINSKGKATFKITKLTKKGKFTAVLKFAGDNTYKAASKKVKITIK